MNINLMSMLQVSIFIFSSQVGSGFFILPSLLSGGGYWSLLVLAIVGLCSIFTINVFAQSGKNVRELIVDGFGLKFSKILFFLYWFISWFSTIVLFKELVGYLGLSSINGFYVEIVIWLAVTLVNMWKLKYTLYIESLLTVMKILPFFLLFIGYYLSYSSKQILAKEQINIGLFLKCVWCFVGLETGSIISKNLKVNEKEKKIGTYTGIFVVVLFYFFSIFFSFKIVGNEVLINNKAPYLVILQQGLQGFLSIKSIGIFVQSLIVLTLIGSINSWTISSGYTAEECGNNGILPKFLATKNRHNVPYLGVLTSSLLVLIFLIVLMVCGNRNVYEIITTSIDISCCFFMAIYGLCLISYSKIHCKGKLYKIFYTILGLLFLLIFVYEMCKYIGLQ